jgi:RNA polymerase sigma-70 factor, ECF subfamily
MTAKHGEPHGDPTEDVRPEPAADWPVRLVWSNTASPPVRFADSEEIRSRLVKAVRRVCPRWMMAHRDDLVQSAMLRILELQNRCDGTRTFSSFYLKKLTYAVLVDEIRRLRHRSEVPLEPDVGAAGEDSWEPASDPERDLQDRQLGQGIRECLRSINAERRQALVLFLQGHSVPEAARILGWSHKKTENLVYRARADLRRRLALMGLKP